MRRRVISLVAAAALVAGGLATTAMAGTVINPTTTKAYSGKVYVAEENLKTATSNSPVTFKVGGALDNSTFAYEPTDIPLGSLSDPTVSFTLTNGKWEIGASPIANGSLCLEDASSLGTEVACYSSGNDTNQLVFSPPSSGSTLNNSHKYILVWDNGTAQQELVEGDIKITLDSYSSKVGVVIKAGSSATQNVADKTGTITIAEAKPQFSAKVDTPFSATISATSGFKAFIGGLSDSLTLNVSDNSSLENAFPGTATYKFVIKATSVVGIDNATVAGGTGGACTIDNSSNEIVCDNITGTTIRPVITLSVDNKTVLAQNTFTVEGFATFDNSSYVNRDSKWPLLPTTAAGQWKYQGVTAYIPAMFSGNGYETWVNLFVEGGTNTENSVTGIVTLSNGSTCAIDLGKVIPGHKFLISADEIVKDVESNANCRAGLYKTGGIYQFPMQINVYTSGQVSGYAVMKNGGAGLTRIPLFSTSPNGVGLDSGEKD